MVSGKTGNEWSGGRRLTDEKCATAEWPGRCKRPQRSEVARKIPNGHEASASSLEYLVTGTIPSGQECARKAGKDIAVRVLAFPAIPYF